MSTPSYNHRDTPLRRFNAFWWGLAYFGLFGLVSVVIYCWSGSSPSVEEILTSEHQETVDGVAAKQQEILSGKQLQPEKIGAMLQKAPSASAVPHPSATATTAAGPIGDPLKGKELYKSKNCMICHGPDGNSPTAPMYPKLGGKEASYLAKKMKDIKSGAYTSALTPMMKSTIDQVSEEEIDHIAQWLADGSK